MHHAVKVVPYSNVEYMRKLEREAAFLEKSSDENVISCFRHWCHSFTPSKECAPSAAAAGSGPHRFCPSFARRR